MGSASPLFFLYCAYRVLRDRRYLLTLGQRFGFLPRDFRQSLPGAIWIHAVSVGEVIAALPLIAQLRSAEPAAPIYLSTTTLTGRAAAAQKLGSSVQGIFYFPFDFVFAVRRVLRTLQPSVAVVLETEIWPNMFREAKRAGCGLVMVNARMSDKTARRYAAFRFFFGPVLKLPDAILAQSAGQRERFLQAGAPPANITVAGNLKFDSRPTSLPADSPIAQFLGRRSGPIWVAASTTADDKLAEEDILIDAARQLPDWTLVLAPRKPERFDEVSAKLTRSGLPFVRRSQLTDEASAAILLLDTIGELSGVFALADVVFMGGTIADRGGHNILEPAFFAKPVIVGPHMENFREIARDFMEHGALIELTDPASLAAAVRDAASDIGIGLRARTCAEARQGASAHAASAIVSLYARSFTCNLKNLFKRIVATPFSWIWAAGSRAKQARDLRKQRTLKTLTISVGNITVGGTGKTPFVLELVDHIRESGLIPGILSRGYGRRSHHEQLVLAAGSCADVGHTGDEPQILLRSGIACIGIGKDRYKSGLLLEERFHPDVLVLDDGFQHLRLGRHLDIVLIDALDPLGSCRIVPVGRLREPLDALARADLFVITRAECARNLDAIEHRLHELNSKAPVFRSRVVPRHWVDLVTGDRFPPTELPAGKSVAFCGLGNPSSFWRTLRRLGIEPVDCVEFGDHHPYTPREVLRLSQQAASQKAEMLLTTEKDLVNLCQQCDTIIQPMRLLWLKIGVEIERESEFYSVLESHFSLKK